MFEVVLQENETGNCKLEIVSTIDDVESDFYKLASEELNGSLSGWFNAYTCI